MNDTLHIWHHLGMGDSIIANGIVRHYASKWKNIVLFYKDPYKKNVERMYVDLKNISFIDGGTKEDNLAKGWTLLNQTKPLLKIRLEHNLTDGRTIDQYFYDQAGIPLSYKWDKFHIERNQKREQEVYYDILGLKNNESYIFLHDYPGIETKYIDNNIKIIRPDNLEISLFDYLYVIEQAKEIHLMNSSFFCLADCIQLKHEKLFYHQYIRGGGNEMSGKLKLNWNILN